MTRPRFYILDGHEPVGLTDPGALDRWAEWFGGALGSKDPRRVAFTDLGWGTVSTVFLGVDHRHFGEGAPILFETMVFGNPQPDEGFPEEWPEMRRYCTWDEAEAGHAEMVAELRERFWQRRANGK